MIKIYMAAVVLSLLTVNLYGQTSPCARATAKADLDINNVRAQMNAASTLWWDLIGSPKYEIPKGSGKHSSFAGGIWIGAIDQNGQLKLAAEMFNKSDFWTGPLRTTDATTDSLTCRQYDKIWKLNRGVVEEFSWKYNQPGYTIPEEILTWPAHGDVSKGYSNYLAPFHDRNGDGVYNPSDGDYPDYDFNNDALCDNRLHGHQTLYWIMNDNGDTHTGSGGAAMGMEVHVQAFAFATNDELNDATFYKYKLINRGSYTLDSTYFGLFNDADVGYYEDDYIGSDVMRGLGYTYNATTIDGSGGATHYGEHPPAFGFDYIAGPYMNADGIDNAYGIGPNESLNGLGFGDGVVDNERLGMSRFMYFNKTGVSSTTDPSQASEFYRYLRGIWKDGVKMVYGGNGHPAGGGDQNVPANFAFPDSSDQQYYWGTNGAPALPWSEESTGNAPGDRRSLVSTGPFTMQPGAVQFITIAAVWARDMNGDNRAAIKALQTADDKAQALMDNCFLAMGASREVPEETAAFLFPNPFSGSATLTFPNPQRINYNLTVYDVTGRVALEQKNITEEKTIINDKNLDSGIYFYKIVAAEPPSPAFSGKFVVK